MSELGRQTSSYHQERKKSPARGPAPDRLTDEARQFGANAVVALRFSTSVIMGGAAGLLTYATAVVIEEGD